MHFYSYFNERKQWLVTCVSCRLADIARSDVSIPLCIKRKAPTVRRGGPWGGVWVGGWRVFVEVDRLAPASWKRLILLGMRGSTLGDARQLPIPISPQCSRQSPTPFFCFPVSTQPPSVNRPQAQGPPHPASLKARFRPQAVMSHVLFLTNESQWNRGSHCTKLDDGEQE